MTVAAQIKEKSRILRDAADRIENFKVRYNWRDPARCNCGILAQATMNLDTAGLRMRLNGFTHLPWTMMMPIIDTMEKRCSGISLPATEVLERLRGVGFTDEEISKLEWLNDPKVTGGQLFTKDSPKDAARYMRIWADQLEATIKARNKRKRK